MDRRKFVTTAALAGAAGTLAACGGGTDSAGAASVADCPEGQDALEPIEWKMVTAWPRDFPGLGTGANKLAEYIDRLSNGYVIDYFLVHTETWAFAVFNVADSMITIGAICIIVDELFSREPDDNQSPQRGTT